MKKFIFESPPKVRVIVKASWVLEAAKKEIEYLEKIGESEAYTPEDIESFYEFLKWLHRDDWYVVDDMKGGQNDDTNNQ